MTTLIELIESFDSDSKDLAEFLHDLISSYGDVLFDIEEVDKAHNAIISTINICINSSSSRYNGLLLLDKILPKFSNDIFSKYCMLWISKATDVLESIHSTPQELSISCKVLGQLIIQSKDIPEIQKQISMQNVKQLIHVIGNLKSDKKCSPIYYLIAVLLYQYPEVCERFQISLRKIILSEIDSTQENLINASAKCYALLTRATERSFKPPASKSNYINWTYNQALICNSLHFIMDELFSDLIELENINIWDKLDLPDISEEGVIQFYLKHNQRFLNLCSYLSYMLRGLDKKNSVLPHDILKVLCRGLAIQPSNLKNREIVKDQILYLTLPKLHIALFNVLDALIDGFKEQLIPYGSMILQLFLQTLEWTENVSENQITINEKKPFKHVRIRVYKCLNSWLMNTNGLSGIETVADEYLPFILKDIEPERDRVLLTIQKTQNLSKRALKRLRDSQYEKGTYLSNEISSNREHYLDADVCKVALDTLQNIFFNSGTLLKQTFFKTVQNTIIPLLYDCYLSPTKEKLYKEHSDCRLLLFRVLRALLMNPHSLIPLPTQYSLELFEMALNDNNLYIKQEAKIAIAELEKIVHPYTPSIQLTQVEIIQKEFVADNRVGQKHTEDDTSGNVEIVNEDVEPSSSKRLKLTNSNKTVESTAEISENQSNVEQATNVVPSEKQVDIITEEMVVVSIQSEKVLENGSEEASEESVNKIPDAMDTGIEIPIQEAITKETKILDVIEEIDCDQKNVSEMLEEELEENEALQLFQDIPKHIFEPNQ